jgi:hypothetical protein
MARGPCCLGQPNDGLNVIGLMISARSSEKNLRYAVLDTPGQVLTEISIG